MPINRGPFNALVDDDGTGLTGSVWNKAVIQSVLLDPIDANVPLYPRQASGQSASGTLHNWNVGLPPGDQVIFWNGTADVGITGYASTGLKPGTILTINNLGTAVMFFYDHHTGSLGANRFSNTVASGPTPVARGGSISWWFNGGEWLMLTHEQGAWIDAPFAAGNFTATAPLVWTVTSGNVSANRYRVTGRTLQWSIWINGGTLSGSPAVHARVTLPNGYTASHSSVLSFGNLYDAGWVPALGTSGSLGSNLLSITRVDYASLNTSAAFYLQGMATCEID